MTTDELQAFPGERPVPSEKDKWFKEAQRIADTTDVGFLLRGETPPSLLKFSIPRAMEGLNRITVPDNATPEQRLSALKFNDNVEKILTEEDIKKQTYEEGCVKIQRSWAATLAKAMKETAPLLLQEAEENSIINNTPGLFNGIEMHKYIRNASTDVDEGERKRKFGLWHENRLNEMLKNRIPDRCTVDEFTAKWNLLTKEPLPHFVTVKLDEEQKARAE